MKIWHAIDVEVDREGEDLVTSELWALDPTGIQVMDETSLKLTLRAFYEDAVDASEVTQRIEDALTAANIPTSLLHRVGWSTVEDQDWLAEWKKNWEPVSVGQRFLIVPSWKMTSAQPGERLVIQIDPGMAFGTGTHETTRGVLEMLERHWPPLGAGEAGGEISLLDVGTGTGILSFAAARLAAAHPEYAGVAAVIVACDVDPDALVVARENGEINGLSEAVEFYVGGPEQFTGRQFDVVLANLTADVLVDIAAQLAARVGGCLIASGILLDQLDGVLEALTPFGLREVERLPDGEWVTVVLGR